MGSAGKVILQAEHIFKSFGPTQALADFSLCIRRGEVHGLIGENGSGKSTFSSIIAGMQREDQGTFTLRGEAYEPKDMPYAQSSGICMIAQEASTFASVKVGYNVFAGNLNRFAKHGLLNEKELMRQADEILRQIGAEGIQANQSTALLNFEDRKIVEIARSMFFDPDILIIDETTTALAQKGRTIIYRLIEEQKQKGKAVLFISHDLDELKSVCNIVTVMRDGKYIATLEGEDISVSNMRNLMVGRELADNYFRSDYDSSCSEEIALELKRATLDQRIKNLDIALHRGEILGLGGLANSGMHEVARIFAGIEKTITGAVVTGSGKTIHSSREAVKNGIGYVSKNRDLEALIQTASIRDNLEMASYDQLTKHMLITNRREKELTERMIGELRIKCVSDMQMVSELSGGNKQKVVFAKWLARDCDVLILDCPTRGIDVGVKAEMYRLIYQLKLAGKAILLVSEELPELIGMSDRMLIFKDGAIEKTYMREERPTEHDIVTYMI